MPTDTPTTITKHPIGGAFALPRPMKGKMKTRDRMSKALIAGGLFILLVLAFTGTAPAQNRIVFSGTGKLGPGKSVSGLFSMNPDGSGLAQLTTNGGDNDPAWSPGQSYVAFVRTTVSGQGNHQTYTYTLYVMEAKGEANGGRIFAVASAGFEPDWSPDGTMILFRTLDYDIAVVSVDVITGAVGTPVKVVATALHEYRPTWSPDGPRIAFAREFGSGTAIYVHDLATGNEIQLPVPGPGTFNDDPEWSPDGSRIAFAGGDNAQIYLVNADGSSLPQQVTNLSGGVRFPTWSPDGTAIAFPYGGIKKMDLTNGVITTVNSFGNNPDWSP